jgi:Tol biopolymer transport system component
VSPEGTLIAFEAARHGDAFQSDIWLMNSDGSDQRRLVSSEAIDAQPAFSPDGRQLAFISNRDYDGNPNDNPMQIYVIQTDGGGLRRVAAPGWCFAPSFSPQGDRLVFVSTSDGAVYRVYSMNLDGSGLQEITRADCHDENPSFSGDGSRIVFDRECDAARDVYAVNADGSGEVNLTPAQHGSQPSWSRDGSQVIFSRVTDFPHLWQMNPDGSNQIQLTSLTDEVTGEPLIGEVDPAGAR